MAQSDAQFRSAARAWEATWINGPDEGPEPPVGTCPTCGGETCNGEQDADEDGRFWTFTDCDTCEAPCVDCGDSGKKHAEDETRCAECVKLNAEEAAETAEKQAAEALKSVDAETGEK